MKKIILILIFTLIKLNAYDYLILNLYDIVGYKYDMYYTDEIQGYLGVVKRYNYNNKDEEIIYTQNSFIGNLGKIKENDSNYWISYSDFNNILKTDNKLLNDFYTTNDDSLQAVLNYFYNDNNFTNESYIYYDDYKLLYNFNGYAVESIVDGVWAGLYSDSEKNVSGKMYSSDGMLLYNNGEEVNWFIQMSDKLLGKFGIHVNGLFAIMGNLIFIVLAVFFVLCIFYYLISLIRGVFSQKG